MTETLRDKIPKPILYQQRVEDIKHLTPTQTERMLDGAIGRQAAVSDKYHGETWRDEDMAYEVALALKPEIDAAHAIGEQISDTAEYGTEGQLQHLKLKGKAVEADIEHNYGLAVTAYMGRTAVETETRLRVAA